MNNKLIKINKKANTNLHNPNPKAFLSKAHGHFIEKWLQNHMVIQVQALELEMNR